MVVIVVRGCGCRHEGGGNGVHHGGDCDVGGCYGACHSGADLEKVASSGSADCDSFVLDLWKIEIQNNKLRWNFVVLILLSLLISGIFHTIEEIKQ